MKVFHSKSIADLQPLCTYLLELSATHRIIIFSGNLGAGKTTIIQRLCALLGVTEPVFSPSFSIVNEYKGAGTIYHFDCYRITSEEEMYDIGYEDYFYSGQLCLIEWPGMIPGLIPEDAVTVQIIADENDHREITVSVTE